MYALNIDMIPNTGVVDGASLFQLAKQNANQYRIYTTFIGMYYILYIIYYILYIIYYILYVNDLLTAVSF